MIAGAIFEVGGWHLLSFHCAYQTTGGAARPDQQNARGNDGECKATTGEEVGASMEIVGRIY
jgi:hypothetical protein